jgi:predicted AAA+ superfamily ATPase
MSKKYMRAQASILDGRLREPRRFVQVVLGARQVGKTTLVQQVLAGMKVPHVYASADEPALRDASWMVAQWERGRVAASESGKKGAVLALDEVQKVPDWSVTVKRLWDEDTRGKKSLRVVLLGSSPLLMQQGLTESLAGRFETLRLPHWSYTEMRTAFGFTLEEYLYFGGYPGAAPLIGDWTRWRQYLLDALIETTIARDVLLMTRVDKPALLRRLFDLGCRYSGQVLSYTKMLGQLQDAGNTTTLAHYLELLSAAGMLMGIQRYPGKTVAQRSSSPKLQVLNTALMTAQSALTPAEAGSDPEFRGRLIESAVGAHLANAATGGIGELFYWRERNREVDFVLKRGGAVVAIEVKSGRAPQSLPGLGAFAKSSGHHRALVVGQGGVPIDVFLAQPVEKWLQH